VPFLFFMGASMGKRYSLEQAADFLSGYRSSGLSMRSYARHRGISESYLGRLSREESKKGENRVSGSVGGFVEVSRPAVLNRCHLVEIQLFNGTTIKING
jgi:lambda repressor-like predicted transcriptional regulator